MWVERQFTPKKGEERNIKKKMRMKGKAGEKIREQGRKGEGENCKSERKKDKSL